MGSCGLRRELLDRGAGASRWIGRVREVLGACSHASGEERRYCEGEDGSWEGRHTGPLQHLLASLYSEADSNPIPRWRRIRGAMGLSSLLMVRRAGSLHS